MEAIQVIKAPCSEEKKHVIPMSSLKDATSVVEDGHPEGWGHVLDLPPNFDKFGLGFSPVGQASTPVKFTSAGFVKDDQANVVGDDVYLDYDIHNRIRTSVFPPDISMKTVCIIWEFITVFVIC